MEKSHELATAEANLRHARGEKFARNKRLRWVYPPHWCVSGDDDNLKWFEDYEYLLDHGQMVWGRVVQANQYLWHPSDVMVAATVIYAHDASDDRSLKLLIESSGRLFALKGAPPAADLRERAYQTMLVDEWDRAQGMHVPASMSNGLDMINTTVMFPRSHMEGQMLGLKHFPLLVHPDKCTAVMVPSVFWGHEFREAWRARTRPPNDLEKAEEYAPRGLWSRFRIGIGTALYWKNILWLALSLIAIKLTLSHVIYQFGKSPTIVSSFDELRTIPSDTFVECTAPLLTRHKLKERTSRRKYWLIPFSQTGHSVFLARLQSKHDDAEYDPQHPHTETVRGRLVRDSDGFDWRGGYKNFSVTGKYRSHDITVPKDYLLIDESAQPSLLWAMLWGAFILLMLIMPLHVAIRVHRAYRILRHDDRELLAKLWWQWNCRTEPENYDYDE